MSKPSNAKIGLSKLALSRETIRLLRVRSSVRTGSAGPPDPPAPSTPAATCPPGTEGKTCGGIPTKQ